MSDLLIQEPPLQVLPSLAVAIGLNDALLLQQLHYWLLKSTHQHDGCKWVYNTIEQWREQFPFWSADTIARALKRLETRGLIRSAHLAKHKWDRTTYFTIEYKAVRSMSASGADPCPQVADMDISSERTSSIRQETTTEMTTESGRKRPARAEFDPDFPINLIVKYAALMGGEQAVRDAVHDAMAHKASDRWKDKQRYVENWLKRDIKQLQQEGEKRGRSGTNPRRAQGNHSEPDLSAFDAFGT